VVPVHYQITLLPSLGGFRTEPYSINDRARWSESLNDDGKRLHVPGQEQYRGIERFDDPPHLGGLQRNVGDLRHNGGSERQSARLS
jgi:hypothetical protein